MICNDEVPILKGDWNAFEAKILVVSFMPCDPAKTKECKFAEETKDFLKGKFVTIAYNKISFVSD